MRKFDIKLEIEEISFFYSAVNVMFQTGDTIEQINYTSYYNIRSLLKYLHNRLYLLQETKRKKGKKFQVLINFNEYQSFKELVKINSLMFSTNDYLKLLFLRIISDCDKQEVDIRDEHKSILMYNKLIQRE